MKMENQPRHMPKVPNSPGVPISQLTLTISTLYSTALLTSPQGILGILSHGIRFIQYH